MANKHMVLFPFMAQGHLIPFLSLAKEISQRHSTYTITLVNTPLNIKKLLPSFPPNSPIKLSELPFSSSDHGLPPNTETTESLPLHQFIDFFHATESLQPSFENLIFEMIQIHGRNNLCIVADMFLGWTVESANKLGVFHSVFVTTGAYGSAMFFSLWLNPPENFDDADELADELQLVDYPEIRLHRSLIINTIILSDGTDPLTAFMRKQLSLTLKSSGLVLNTAEEFEVEGLSLLRRSPGLRLWSIGPLIRCSSSTTHAISNNCLEWLNSQSPASVLYISFGSQNSITSSEMMQLAKGLEACCKPFIWAIRPPSEFRATEDFRAEWLPEGFTDRIKQKNQGILVHKWAPQLEILAHSSTSAFLSHCGWNSVVESLSQGVPIIGWPIVGDQIYNSKIMEEMGVCVEVARGMSCGLRDGWEGVAKAIELVMGGTRKGDEMRRKAGEIQETMRRALREDEKGDDGSSLRAMDDFLRTAFQ